MFGRWLNKYSVNLKRKEMTKFLDSIRPLDGEEVGIFVAASCYWREFFLKQGIDLMTPATVAQTHPQLSAHMAGLYQKGQKDGYTALAMGLIPWIHTLDAFSDFELRGLGRDIWRELQRGFPYAPSMVEEVSAMIGKEIDTTGYDSFPDGLTPDPI